MSSNKNENNRPTASQLSRPLTNIPKQLPACRVTEIIGVRSKTSTAVKKRSTIISHKEHKKVQIKSNIAKKTDLSGQIVPKEEDATESDSHVVPVKPNKNWKSPPVQTQNVPKEEVFSDEETAEKYKSVKTSRNSGKAAHAPNKQVVKNVECSDDEDDSSKTRRIQAPKQRQLRAMNGSPPTFEVIDLATSSDEDEEVDQKPSRIEEKQSGASAEAIQDVSTRLSILESAFRKSEKKRAKGEERSIRWIGRNFEFINEVKTDQKELMKVAEPVRQLTADVRELTEIVKKNCNGGNLKEKIVQLFKNLRDQFSNLQKVVLESNKPQPEVVPTVQSSKPIRQRQARQMCGACNCRSHRLRDCLRFETAEARIDQYTKTGRCTHCDEFHMPGDICRFAKRPCQHCPEPHLSGLCKKRYGAESSAEFEGPGGKRRRMDYSGVVGRPVALIGNYQNHQQQPGTSTPQASAAVTSSPVTSPRSRTPSYYGEGNEEEEQEYESDIGSLCDSD
ncbi:unnamed protein product [Caenorhabditis sp. 36 PRJEB53466]|nr:unnamed protein product [Caenorhabditis sp. 36 PRJEB53466]